MNTEGSKESCFAFELFDVGVRKKVSVSKDGNKVCVLILPYNDDMSF